jgi:Mrp family chromosome partitioning ATPase
VLGAHAIRTVRGRGYQITLDVGAMDAQNPPESRKAPDVNLPSFTYPDAVLRTRQLLGRDKEIVEVMHSVRTNAVTTLVGPGGVGKTALAGVVAAALATQSSTAPAVAFADGVFTVWLALLSTAELVAAEVAVALGLSRSGGLAYL